MTWTGKVGQPIIQILNRPSVVILGNSGVGKTTVLGRWIDNQFTVTSATISVEFSNKSFRVDDKLVKVQLWDTGKSILQSHLLIIIQLDKKSLEL